MRKYDRKISNYGSKFIKAALMRTLHQLFRSRTLMATLTFLCLLSSGFCQTTLTIATTMPANSLWGKALKAWANQVEDLSKSELVFKIFDNGAQGNEPEMVQKMKSKQLDGALLTAPGLQQINVNFLLFQMPGLFNTWTQLDTVRNNAGLQTELNALFDQQGFINIGWGGDTGQSKIMSHQIPVSMPIDLKKGACADFSGDPILPAMFNQIQGVNVVSLTIPAVLPNLSVGRVSIIITPSSLAKQFQWSSKITDINTLTIAFNIGAIVFSKASVEALTPELKTMLLTTGKEAAENLNTKSRSADQQAFDILKTKTSTVDSEGLALDAWQKIFTATQQDLKGNPFLPALWEQVVNLANAARQ